MWRPLALVIGVVPPQRLMFKSPDGSLTLAGMSMLATGIFLLVASGGEVVGAIYWARRSSKFRPIQIVLGVWGTLGLIVGIIFVVLPQLASPGVAY